MTARRAGSLPSGAFDAAARHHRHLEVMRCPKERLSDR